MEPLDSFSGTATSTATTMEMDTEGSEDFASTAEAKAQQAKAALEQGDFLRARQLVAQGLEQWPDDAHLQRLAILYAPPRVKPRRATAAGASGSTSTEELEASERLKRSFREANRRWLREHRAEYRGQWVAVSNGELLGAAPTVAQLRDQVGDTSRALVTKIF